MRSRVPAVYGGARAAGSRIMERIQKILARGGIASRRAAETFITEGRVRINGRVITELGAKADARRDRIEVDGKRVVAEDFIYAVLHKPRGVVSTMSDPEGRPTVRELLTSLGARVYPVGRLDFATSGVLLVTNDGEFADALLHPKRAVPKTYVIKVKGVMTEADLDHFRKGVHLEDGVTLPAEVRLDRYEGDKTWIELTLREGRNQQIRRMGEATGFPVMRLARLSFADINAEGLKPGQFRRLTRDELIALKKTYGVPRSVAAGVAAGAKGESRGRGARPKSAPTKRSRQIESGLPRYGGGSPGRRSYDVSEDWGGGARRGASGGRYPNDPDRASWRDHGGRERADLGGGRLARTRTTGTGGGIGASGPVEERVKGRRSKQT
ncbi:MAG: rRNA pseudouridine synthase [Polyangiaceae bacterium]|nr:rRNA pseudouridine synthase [Polyangiaceae bacterium]